MSATLREQVEQLPDSPGIYVFRDAGGTALYVGKAKSLRKRVGSYLSRPLEPRLANMIESAVRVEFVGSATESAALLLENNWIKRLRPRFNVLLRDDKTYPYLKLTHDPWPRLVFTRRIRQDGADYFGPYLPAGLARRAVKLVQRLFGIRVCDLEIDGSLPRPCLYHDMKRCLGPCVTGLTTRDEYAAAVESTKLFLAGRIAPLARGIREEMREASERLDYERAARLRDLLREIEGQGERSPLSSVDAEDSDIFGVAVHGGQAAVSILVMRGGQTLDRRELFWEERPRRLRERCSPSCCRRSTTGLVPPEGDPSSGRDRRHRSARGVACGEAGRARLLPLSGTRSQGGEAADRRHGRGVRLPPAFPRQARSRRRRRSARGPPRPRRAAALDRGVRHLQPPGTSVVASMVAWRDGKVRKSDYRSFNIRGFAGQDDFRSLAEA
ncbi:MAG: UvrB/UvrC motif-containing protein [Thermoanaerobaculia bacterium]